MVKNEDVPTLGGESPSIALAKEDPARDGVCQSDTNPTLDAVSGLMNGFSAGSEEQVQDSLLRLGADRESALYCRVGELTRVLHNALDDFRKNLDTSAVTMHSTSIPDAAHKLETVIQMTQEAANTTLNCVEDQGDLIQHSLERVNKLRETTETSLPLNCTETLKQIQHDLETMSQKNSAILMAQAFQDLTGQSLRKVIRLVTEIEKSLLSLVQIFGDQQSAPANGQSLPEQPESQIAKPNIAQDDVNDLLSKFGF